MHRGIVHALVFAVGGAVWGGRLLQKRLSPDAPRPAHVAFDPEEVNRTLRQLEQRAKDDPKGATGLGLLAGAYLRRQREQGDPGDLVRAEAAARKSVAARSYNNPIGLSALARALIGQHRFAEAESLALRAGDLGLAGECALERGDYPRARKLVADAASASPDDPGVRVTQARLFELTGETVRAESAYRNALAKIDENYEAPAPTRAWFRTRLGIFLATYGKSDEARAELESAKETFENPQTTLALARLAASESHWDEAKSLARDCDLPEATMLLADVEHAQGNRAAAETARAKVISESGGRHVHGRALALFLADHDLDPALAVELMKTEGKTRHDVETADALAWTYFKAGQPDKAQTFVQRASAEGYAAPTFFWHAGRIAEALGDLSEAKRLYERALETHPNFHPLGAADAKSRLENLK